MDALDPTGGEPQREALAVFLRSLTDHGVGLISPGAIDPVGEETKAELRRLHVIHGQSVGLEWPALSISAGLWAATVFHHLCQATVSRDTGMEEIHECCRVPCPELRNPETDASVDLVFRHLKHLHDLGRHLSHGDPMLGYIRELGATWPLSSVGIPGVKPVSLESFLEHSALRRVYLDRILEADDTSRLGDPKVDDYLRRDLGIHRHLAPALSSALFITPSIA